MSNKNIEELISQMDTIPFLFVGSGLTRRYFNLPNWNNLLKHMANQINSDEYSFDLFVSRAREMKSKYGLNPAIATVIEKDFNEIWYKNPKVRHLDDYYLKKVKEGCSPFKAEIAQYIKSNSILNEASKSEVKLLQNVAKKSIAGIITTNYDLFLETYLSEYKVYTGQNELLFSQLQGIAEVYKIHGSVSDPQSIVINESDYREFIDKKEYLAAKLLTIFMEYPIIFMGYSISDKNIIDILSSIVECMDNSKLDRLKNKFIFIDYDEEYSGYSIDDSIFTFENGKMLIMTKITLSDYSILYKALCDKKMKLPVRLLRHLKDELYEYVLTNQPTKNIKVASLDDERISNDELVLSIGTIDTSDYVGLKGLKGINTAQWYRNIVLDDLEFDNNTLLSVASDLARQNSGKLPINSLVSTEEQKSQFDRLYIKDFDSLLSKTIKDNKEKHKELNSIENVIDLKLGRIHKECLLISYLDEEKIDLDKLEDYLRNIFESDPDILISGSNETKTNLRRLIRIFDYLKGKK